MRPTDRSPDAGKQEGDQVGEGQIALASEVPRLTTRSVTKSGALKEGREFGKYIDIFRTSYLTYKYQLVKDQTVAQGGQMAALAMKYAETLSHED